MNKKLFLYCDNQMNADERKKFEEELKTDPALQAQYNNYLGNIKKLRKYNSVELNEKYFVNAVPVMHGRIESRKHFSLLSPKFGLALSSMTAVLLVFLMFFGKTTDNTIKLEKSLKGLSTEEISNVLDTYSNNESQLDKTIQVAEIVGDSGVISAVGDKLASEIIPNNEQLTAMESSESYEYLTGSINEKEADIVYNEIIKKEFFKGK
ncbi:MAG: hypothetical protein Q8903_04240 [Bacteroidota bacterium]|nr:hypothetical protein [Bacteroidota bacterium]